MRGTFSLPAAPPCALVPRVRHERPTTWLALGLWLFALACSKTGEGSDSAPSASASSGASPAASSAAPLVDFEPAPSGSAPPPAAASASSAPAPSGSAEAPEKAKPVQRSGSAGEFFSRARSLDLSDEQKSKLDAIDARVWGGPKDTEETKTALKEFFAALVDGVKTGHIVDAKLAPHYATLEAQAKARHDEEAKALNELHELLEPEQRKELVTQFEKKYAPADKAKPPKPVKPPSAAEKAHAADRLKRRVARVTALLGLDDKQQKRVEPVLVRFDTESRNKAHRQAVEKRMKALIAAFGKDTFDATKLDVGKGPRARMSDRVAYVSSLLTLLKTDQRDKLARTLERPTARRWGAAVVGDAGPVDEE